jgi:hypothetical protein
LPSTPEDACDDRKSLAAVAIMESHFEKHDEHRRRPALWTEDARSALQHLDTDRAFLAQRIVTPWWYHPTSGVVTATLERRLAAFLLLLRCPVDTGKSP